MGNEQTNGWGKNGLSIMLIARAAFFMDWNIFASSKGRIYLLV